MRTHTRRSHLAFTLSAALSLACSSASYAAVDLPKPAVDIPPPKPGEVREAVFAGGCFWCTEGIFEQIEGVVSVESGYAGGTKETATYRQVSEGDTGHAESIRIRYDSRITFGTLLQILLTMSDPTSKDAQGPDHGHQYRSAIFYATPEEKNVAEAYLKQLEAARLFPVSIATTIEPLNAFYPAEAYHQDYAARHPDDPYLRAWYKPKLEKLLTKFPKLLKKK